MAKYQGKSSSYELSLDKEKKVFHAQATGFFREEDGISFLKDYDEITKDITPNTYALIIDAPDLQPSSPAVAEALGVLLQKYMEVPFKSRFLVTKGNPVTQMQFRRLGNSIPGWTQSVQYVDDLDAAMKLI